MSAYAKSRHLAVLLAAGVLLAGCGAPRPLPPEQRHTPSSRMQPLVRPDGYRVVRGDTLYSIAFRYGLDWREVARWNALAPPYTIHVDDWIRLHPPPEMQVAVARTGPAPASGADSGARTPDSGSDPSKPDPETPAPAVPERESEPEPENGPEPGNGSEPESGPAAKPAAPQSPRLQPRRARGEAIPVAAERSAAGVRWRWPTAGRVVRAFDARATRKGVLIAGEAGQPVRAAAAGEVVYSGNGLIGYGELIIVKHSERMLSAYAHNRERLVGEGESVAAGQMIARMGRNERDDTVLHFEIRRDGRPEDPAGFLPPR